jgi:hypothetical protein
VLHQPLAGVRVQAVHQGPGRVELALLQHRTRSQPDLLAHRFGYGLAHGFDALMAVEVVAHACDNPLCQRPAHWCESTHAANRREWATRRHQLSGPLRDLRGARGRAVAIRDAVRAGRPLAAVLAAGVSPLDRDQLALFELDVSGEAISVPSADLDVAARTVA